jgi:hypothetical protein
LLNIVVKRNGSVVFFSQRVLCNKNRPTKRAQMKWEVKGAREIASNFVGRRA